MVQNKPKALFVGDARVGEVLARLRPRWEFEPFVKDIMSLWDGLNSGEINNEVQAILVMDQFFDPKGQDEVFETFVQTMAPYAFIGIINYRPSLQEEMRERIDFKMESTGVSEHPYYFIDKQKPNPSIDEAVDRFVTESPLHEIAAILSGRSVDEVRASSEPAPEPAPVAQASYPDAIDEWDNEEVESDYLGQVVAITSSKGGSGKSTVAISVASYLGHASINSVKEGLEERPLKVCILDLDVRDGQLGFLTGNSKPTVIKLRLEGVSVPVIEQTVIHSDRLKADLLLAPKRPRNSDDTPPDFYVDLIHNLRKMYDYIILDTSVNYLDPLLEKVAYPTADLIVFVTDIVVNSVFSMTRWIQEVTTEREKNGMGISRNKIGIVVNKTLSNVNMSGQKIARSALGIPVISAIPSQPKLCAYAANMQSLEVLMKHPDMYPAIRRIARSVTGKLYKLSDNVTV